MRTPTSTWPRPNSEQSIKFKRLQKGQTNFTHSTTPSLTMSPLPWTFLEDMIGEHHLTWRFPPETKWIFSPRTRFNGLFSTQLATYHPFPQCIKNLSSYSQNPYNNYPHRLHTTHTFVLTPHLPYFLPKLMGIQINFCHITAQQKLNNSSWFFPKEYHHISKVNPTTHINMVPNFKRLQPCC